MQKRGKKAQAAMEFLTTYGWAIIILLVIIVALAGLGVFRGPKTPSFCTSQAPIACTDVKISGTTLTLGMSASGSFTTSPTIPDTPFNVPEIYIGSPSLGTLPSGQGPFIIGSSLTTIQVSLPSSVSAGTRFSGYVNVTYTPDGGLLHKINLPFSGTAE